jgi:hypothetical protein
MIANEDRAFAVAYDSTQGTNAVVQPGLAKHELFAAMALQGLLANPGVIPNKEALNENLQSELTNKATNLAKKLVEKLDLINQEIKDAEFKKTDDFLNNL